MAQHKPVFQTGCPHKATNFWADVITIVVFLIVLAVLRYLVQWFIGTL